MKLIISCINKCVVQFDDVKDIELLSKIDYIKSYIENWAFGKDEVEIKFSTTPMHVFLNIYMYAKANMIMYRCLDEYKETLAFAKYICHGKGITAELEDLYHDDDIVNDILYTDRNLIRTLNIESIESDVVYERDSIVIKAPIELLGSTYTIISNTIPLTTAMGESYTFDHIRNMLKSINNIEDAKVVIAGGLANAFYTNNLTVGSDTDIFVITDDPAKIIELVVSLKRYLFNSMDCSDNYFITRSRYAITFVRTYNRKNCHDDTCIHEIQVILNPYKTIQQLLNDFDVDCCCIAYDGDNFYYNDRYKRSVETHCIFVNPHRDTISYGYRLRKYMNRGYMIAVSGFDINRVNMSKMEKYTLHGLAGIISDLITNEDKFVSVYNPKIVIGSAKKILNNIMSIAIVDHCQLDFVISDNIESIMKPTKFIDIPSFTTNQYYRGDVIDDVNKYMEKRIEHFKVPLLESIQGNSGLFKDRIPCDNWFYDLYDIT